MAEKLPRITQAEDYRRVMRQGHRVGGPVLVTHAVLRTGNDPARFGFVVSKKVGNAVVRNRITRRLKAIALELVREHAISADVVFRAQPAAANASFQELHSAASAQLQQLAKRQTP